MSTANPISTQTLRRLPTYYNYLKSLPADVKNISATSIARELRLNDVQVRKDLALVSGGGRPKVGYVVEYLMNDIGRYLRYDYVDRAVLVGAGNMGHALMCYEGFAQYGLDIVTAFDNNSSIIGTYINGKRVLPIEEMGSICSKQDIKIGIITVPSAAAQNVCDMMVKSGIKAIWNFAAVKHNTPKGVIVQNEDLVASLVVLSQHLKKGSSEAD